MNINNVVMVRAMSHIPFDGELIPSCEGQRLVDDQNSDFAYFMRNIVKKEMEEKLGRSINLWEETEDKKLYEKTLQNYKTLTGDYYTTTLSFSLNGMVPDDINNNFTDMKIAVLDPIRNHKDKDFVTVETIDTTIKGRIKVSSDAILLIDEGIYLTLSEEQKNNLNSNYQVKLFRGALRDAVGHTLKENNYPVLPLIQKREMKNIQECPERESMLKFEDEFANLVNASRLRLEDLTIKYGGSPIEADQIAHEKLEEELPNTITVQNYYKQELYNFLLKKTQDFGLEITDEEKFYLFSEYSNGQEVMEKMTLFLIESYGGIEKFRGFIEEYNNMIKQNYLTNEEIVSLDQNTKER